MNFNSNFVDECFDCVKEIETEATILDKLSTSFHLTGNDNMSDKLYRQSERLKKIADRVKTICADKINRDYQEVQNAAGNMLKACLAGAELSKKDLTIKD